MTNGKSRPIAVVTQGKGSPVAILNRNKPVFYAVPTQVYEDPMDALKYFLQKVHFFHIYLNCHRFFCYIYTNLDRQIPWKKGRLDEPYEYKQLD